MSGIKFNDNELMQIYMETNGQVTEYVFSNGMSIHDERNIKQIFEETAKKNDHAETARSRQRIQKPHKQRTTNSHHKREFQKKMKSQ